MGRQRNAAALHNAYIDWIENSADWNVSGTFTFPADTSVEAAQRTFQHFWNLIDRRIYRKAAQRYSMRVERVCFIEGRDSNVHFHFIAKMPDRLKEVEHFKRLLLWVWQDLGNTGWFNQVGTTTCNRGWASYISKNTRFDADAMDLNTTHISG